MSTARPPTPLDCYEGDPELLPAAEALRRIETHVGSIRGDEEVDLRSALDRVLARDVISPLNVPGHTNSAMDGYAMSSAVLPSEGERRLRVIGAARAGAPFEGTVTGDAAVQIMTGAVMPRGADTVVMQEHVKFEDGHIVVGPGHRPRQHVRAAGEDLQAGQIVLSTGKRLIPAELGLLASLGIGRVMVRRRLRVAMFSTGDELRSIGESLAPGQIYDSNRYTLYGMLTRLGVELNDMGVVRDDREAVRAAFESAAARADVVVTSGGASTGDADHIKEVLSDIGEVGFWRVAIRPGRPLAFGRVGDAMLFGLPGNPVAVMVTFYQFVQPALRRMMGESGAESVPTIRATSVTPLRKKPGRVEYYRAVLRRDEDGRVVVEHTGKTGSGLLHTMSDANCLIILPEEAESVAAGAEVDVQPFFGLI